MYGFIGIYGDGDLLTHGSIDTRRFQSPDLSIIQHIPKKFTDDNIFIDNEHFTFMINGVILNDCELFEKYNQQDLTSLVKYFFSSRSKTFFLVFEARFQDFFLINRQNNVLFLLTTQEVKKSFTHEQIQKYYFQLILKNLQNYYQAKNASHLTKNFYIQF